MNKITYFQTPEGLTITTVDSSITDCPVHCVTDPLNMVYSYNIGNSLWSASFDLINCLKKHSIIGDDQNMIKNNKVNIVEVGAGCGSIGLVLWKNGYRATITDMDEMLPIMTENIRYNKEEGDRNENDIQALALDWTNPSSAEYVYEHRGPFRYIVGAEVSYDEALHPAFVDTLLILCGGRVSPASTQARMASSSSYSSSINGDQMNVIFSNESIAILAEHKTKIILAIPQRDDDENVIEEAERKGFKCKVLEVIKPNDHHASPVVICELSLSPLPLPLPKRKDNKRLVTSTSSTSNAHIAEEDSKVKRKKDAKD